MVTLPIILIQIRQIHFDVDIEDVQMFLLNMTFTHRMNWKIFIFHEWHFLLYELNTSLIHQKLF